MTSPAAMSGQEPADLVARITELANGVNDLARTAAGGGANQPYMKLLSLTLDRMNRRVMAIGNGSTDIAELCELLTDVSAVQSTLRKHALGQPNYAPGRIFEALARVRRKVTSAEVLEVAPAELCAAGGFDRAMISRVHGSTWVPKVLFLSDGGESGVNRELKDFVADREIPLASPMLEAEVVRRRLPALVQNAQSESKAFHPLMEASQTREYVVAPIVASGSVVGLLHADAYRSQRPLTNADRDVLRTFAEGVGLIYERTTIAERLEQQREQISAAFRAAEKMFDDHQEAPVRLEGPAVRSAVALPQSAVVAELPESAGMSRLTTREREVLALLASGATNAQVADQLTVAESTVKSHVKHILHKLGTTNRAGAIARYMRTANTNERRS